MGERIDPEIKLFCHFHHHVDLRLDIGMAGDKSFLVQDLENGLLYKVPARSDGSGFFFWGQGVVGIPVFFIFAGIGERIHIDLLNTHPGLGVTDGVGVAGPLYIFSQCELNESIGSPDHHILRRFTPTEFDQRRLSANWVG